MTARIEDDTPILPSIVAESVIHEVDRCAPLGMSLTQMRALADKFADRADAIYARNESFRRKIRGRGDTGRDALYAFMRHWLSSELKKSRPHVFAQLPQSFLNGEELDCGAVHSRAAAGRRHHATKKSSARLDRELFDVVGKRIDRKKLGEMMSPWGGDFAYGTGTGAIGAVASYYYSGKKYPERRWVEQALSAIEADIPKAERGAHGWTTADARDLRTIAAGLRHYLVQDYA